ncbi:hypothetical protein [Kiloniella sp.]|uniref:hypothetical protein n=1 Tax=Kiloniella sp. TaxID=1938587 RepID=UPI003B02A280
MSFFNQETSTSPGTSEVSQNLDATPANQIVLGGEKYACGLEWVYKGPSKPSLAYLIENGRAMEASSSVRYQDQIGYVTQEHHDLDNLVPAATLVADFFSDKAGTLLVILASETASEKSETDCLGSYLIVQAKDGVLLPNGDAFYPDPVSALAAFKTELNTEWQNIFISDTAKDLLVEPELSDAQVEPFSLSDIITEEAYSPQQRKSIKPLPFKSIRVNNLPLWGGLTAGATAIVGGLYLATEIVMPMFFQQTEHVIVVEKPQITPTVSFVDPTSLLEACFTSLQSPPSELIGWDLTKVTCSPSSSNIGTSIGSPLFGEPTLFYEWRIAANKNKAIFRRSAEKNLSEWNKGVVLDDTAFGFIPVKALKATFDSTQLPGKAAFRKQVDLVFGAITSDLHHSESAGHWSVRFSTPLSLEQLAKRTAQVPGLRIMSVTKSGNFNKRQSWAVEASLAQVLTVPGNTLAQQGIN